MHIQQLIVTAELNITTAPPPKTQNKNITGKKTALEISPDRKEKVCRLVVEAVQNRQKETEQLLPVPRMTGLPTSKSDYMRMQ